MKRSVLKQIPQWRDFKNTQPLPLIPALVIIFSLCTITFLWRLGSIGLIDETEPLFAEAARQMVETGNWVTPYYNGETRFDKPPLIYWLMAMGYQVLGVNEWAVRLPSALSALGLTGFVFFVLDRVGVSPFNSASNTVQKRWGSFIAAATLALTPEFIIWARTGVSDLLLTGCMGSALLCFFMGYINSETESPPPFFSLGKPSNWYISFYIFTALAVLAKGPVGLVLPGLIMIAFLVYQGNLWQVFREMRVMSGWIIFLVLTVPWYILVILENGQSYIDSFFGYHNFQRFTGVVNDHDAPWYFYFLVVLIGFAPLSVYLPSAIAQLQVWRRRVWKQQPREKQLGLFAFFWFITIFLFFTIAVTKLPSYVIPLLPAAAILMGLFWSNDQPENFSTALKVNILFNLIFVFALGAAFYYSPNLIGYDPAAPNLSEIYSQAGLHLAASVIWLGAGLLISLTLRAQQDIRWLWGINLLAMLLTFVFVLQPAIFLVDQFRQKPLRELSKLEQQVRQPEEELIMIGMEKPSVAFYTQHQVTFLDETEYAIAHLKAQPETESVLLLSHPRKLNSLISQAEQVTFLGRQGEYQLLRIQMTNDP
ncbi:glycosyl transferase family 39 [Halothece sp. PCC 7418]|uniref:ArnT family glycosyltransferase n=1 Tax=Halothece sp. (strain PCC 7418) TaxID=65093 RepID=UPI0002A08A0A|nr:glycosyltransferase family 39 protein [Halothece sp. PCC 7418]AFZ43689.1 glycosyl transferase family 39 [Halothece sp. PCC 7418]